MFQSKNKPNEKLEQVTKLKRLEEQKDKFETQLRAVSSYYFEKGSVTLEITTQDYNDKGTTHAIPFDKDFMTKYLKAEITSLERQSDRIIEQLATTSDLS